MTNASIIRGLVDELPYGAVVSVPELVERARPLLSGRGAEDPRNAVSQVLFQMVKSGDIQRRAWGSYWKVSGAREGDSSDEVALDPEFVAREYLRDDGGAIGYRTGQSAVRLYRLGDAPLLMEVASNKYSPYTPSLARKQGIVLKRPKVPVDDGNAAYLQALDVLDCCAERFLRELAQDPPDEKGVRTWLKEVRKRKLDPGRLVGIAGKYYSKRLVAALAEAYGIEA